MPSRGAVEAVVAVRRAGVVGGVVADAGGKNGAGGLGCDWFFIVDADEVDQAAFRLAVRMRRVADKEREAVGHAVALELVVNDGQAALFEGADAHAGGLQFRAGKEHQLAKAGAQVALRA